ncbi:MAG: hypothetical protein PWR22_928 [Moorella sp. (in: firmicutes)]|jgi:hypothetical protein|uniref:DUF7680 family protein n=1 Tax=Moorella sp. E308F TaxID=2572682 RepID=UPI0010FFB4C4|nr:hypothetical protein [Moorella sp. E308F]MDK2816299.1 hypothetical protein [Moorella sp. (in: firmicutes)]MDK2895245.1 hypothetical protein [Moorella sp. (in: firmicutes)]GEA14124.1 hypothetical protein E308F_03650 [Moorella sp. E308F]
MTKQKPTDALELERDFQQRIRPLLPQAPWVLRVTEFKDKPIPVLVVKERLNPGADRQKNGGAASKTALKERGYLYGQPLRRCLPVIRTIIGGVCDAAGIPLELQRFLGNGRISFRGNLPLDEEAGVKLALIFKLQERVKEMDRVELMAWRVARFTREEAAYWLTRGTQYGEAANRWALAGMRIMLGGQPGDKAILQLLEKLRR